jgi:hypothetical protein
MSDLSTCPHCDGNGGLNVFVNRGADISLHGLEWFLCRTCGGSGQITRERAESIARGQGPS